MSATLLRATDLVAGYDGRAVLFDVSIELRVGEILCLIGHNGAGKSTLLKTLFGLVPKQSGTIELDGHELRTMDTRKLTAAGLSLVPEGRGVFTNLTVDETMRMAMWATDIPRGERQGRVDWVLSILPAMKEFYKRRTGTLSGGQKQIVSIGRALLSQPRCLLMDEPSIGLAPKLFQDLLQPICELQRKTQMSILLVEQNVHEALKIAHRVVAMKSGRIIAEALPGELQDNAKLMELY